MVCIIGPIIDTSTLSLENVIPPSTLVEYTLHVSLSKNQKFYGVLFSVQFLFVL